MYESLQVCKSGWVVLVVVGSVRQRAALSTTTIESAVEAPFRQVDHAFDHLCVALGLKAAA